MRDFASNVLANLAANLVATVIIAILPSVFALIIYLINQQINPLCLIITSAWSLNSLAAVFWYINHRNWRARRLIILAGLMALTDVPVYKFIVQNLGHLEAPQLQGQIKEILRLTCQIIAYRAKIEDKGASFLFLNGNKFELYDEVGHRAGLDIDIKENLTIENSLAGQALNSNKCLIIANCKRNKSNLKWANLGKESEYIGRAVVPVQALVKNKPGDAQNIGVLCFDLKKPLRLTEEEQKIMLHIADKIASIWVLCQPNNQ
jgi:hypothetical protein